MYRRITKLGAVVSWVFYQFSDSFLCAKLKVLQNIAMFFRDGTSYVTITMVCEK